jgi:hypothetical protein
MIEGYKNRGRRKEEDMTVVTREILVQSLEKDWGTYVEKYRGLSEEERIRFVKAQGFARFADIPAHVIAWWEEGKEVLERMLDDPAYPAAEYNVNEFNARAVARFAKVDEDQVIKTFDSLRLDMLRLVAGLPESAFRDQRITNRLQIEILGHYSEHKP